MKFDRNAWHLFWLGGPYGEGLGFLHFLKFISRFLFFIYALLGWVYICTWLSNESLCHDCGPFTGPHWQRAMIYIILHVVILASVIFIAKFVKFEKKDTQKTVGLNGEITWKR